MLVYLKYSSVPNKRSYLNNHTYLNFAKKLINGTTQISVPIGNLPIHSKSLYLPECTGKWKFYSLDDINSLENSIFPLPIAGMAHGAKNWGCTVHSKLRVDLSHDQIYKKLSQGNSQAQGLLWVQHNL